jgi:ABC-type phosphate transport system ATPase subunit
MIRGFLVACLLVVLFGCATGEKIQDVHVGMSKGQVIAFLGKPDGSQRSGEYEALRYTNRTINGSSPDRADYNVILLEGSVVEYGFGYVRQRDPTVNNRLILVPSR